MSIQDDLAYLIVVAEESNYDTSELQKYLKEARHAESQDSYGRASDYIKKALTGQHSFNPDSSGFENETAVELLKDIHDRLVQK